MSAKLHATANYDLFELCEFNRDVEKTKRLEKSMQKHGFIQAYPLHVIKNGSGKLKIKAGHHRYVVARKLCIPIWYVVCEDEATIQELEGSTIPWQMVDFLNSFVRCGVPAYLQVDEYIRRTGINISCAISMLGGQCAGSGNFQKSFKDGTYKVSDSKHAELVAEIILHCKAAGLAWASNNSFVAAMSKALKVSSVSYEQLKRRITAHVLLMKKQPSVNAYMDLIEEIYNRGSHEKIPVAFLATQAAKERRPPSLRDLNDEF